VTKKGCQMSAPWPEHFPSESQNFGDLHVGDTKDDDAQIIDDDIREVDTPPTPITEPIPHVSLEDTIKRTTKLGGVTQTLAPSWSTPTLLLPANDKRVGLQIKATSPTAVATDFVVISSDPGLMQGNNAFAGALYHGQSLTLDYHTGAVYATALGASLSIIVTAWETSK